MAISLQIVHFVMPICLKQFVSMHDSQHSAVLWLLMKTEQFKYQMRTPNANKARLFLLKLHSQTSCEQCDIIERVPFCQCRPAAPKGIGPLLIHIMFTHEPYFTYSVYLLCVPYRNMLIHTSLNSEQQLTILYQPLFTTLAAQSHDSLKTSSSLLSFVMFLSFVLFSVKYLCQISVCAYDGLEDSMQCIDNLACEWLKLSCNVVCPHRQQ